MLDPAVTAEVLTMLESVITGPRGTAPLARVPGYRVTGKTGTARLLKESGGYEEHRYNSSFIGIAPASKPQLLVAVFLHDPRGKVYYGGYTAGPVFSKIMGGALRLLDIPPDNPNDLNKIVKPSPVATEENDT